MTRFCIVVAVYKAPQYIERCLTSLQEQDHSNYTVCIVDDHSEEPEQHRIISDMAARNQWTAIFNDQRRGALYNQVAAIKEICSDPEDVIVFVDGDDQLTHINVLKYLDNIYSQNKNIELTYGSYQSVPYAATCPPAVPYPPGVVENKEYRHHTRKHGLLINHLRTFKYKLFLMMDENVDFKLNGEWFSVATDTAMMIPALELSKEHKVITDVLYNYSSDNPISDWRVNAREIDRVHDYILSLPKKVRDETVFP